MTAPMDPPGFPDPRQYPATDEGLLAALNALGDTRNKVTSTLDAGGWHGRLGCYSRCPTALYLTDALALPPNARVNVSQETASVIDLDGARLAFAMLPEPVRLFIAKFDAGQLPALIGAV